MTEKSPHVKLALAAAEAYLTKGELIGVPPEVPEDMLSTRAGAFICFKKYGQLRGCIGTIEPVQENLALEIIKNTISAATEDPRFLPVQADELKNLECCVDVLMSPEPVNDVAELDPKTYGVIVESGSRRGLLLPDLEGVDTVEQQIDIACHKALIKPNESIKLYRFKVNRYN